MGCRRKPLNGRRRPTSRCLHLVPRGGPVGLQPLRHQHAVDGHSREVAGHESRPRKWQWVSDSIARSRPARDTRDGAVSPARRSRLAGRLRPEGVVRAEVQGPEGRKGADAPGEDGDLRGPRRRGRPRRRQAHPPQHDDDHGDPPVARSDPLDDRDRLGRDAPDLRADGGRGVHVVPGRARRLPGYLLPVAGDRTEEDAALRARRRP
jgi:hypothetical protein